MCRTMGTGSLGTRQQPRLGGSVQYCLRDLLGLNTVCVTSADVPMKCGAFNPLRSYFILASFQYTGLNGFGLRSKKSIAS